LRWAQQTAAQQRTIAAIDKVVVLIASGTIAQALAQECLGAAKAHLDMMQEVDADEKRMPA
jgi:hypothetical protein